MNAHDMLSFGHKDVHQAFEGLSGDQWKEVGVTTRWTLKDMLAHLTSFEVTLSEALEKVKDPKTETPTLDDLNDGEAGFNDRQVETRSKQSPEALLKEYDEVHEKVMDSINELGPAKLSEVGTIPWYGANYSLDDYVVYTNYGHKREHLAQVKMFRRLHDF